MSIDNLKIKLNNIIKNYNCFWYFKNKYDIEIANISKEINKQWWDVSNIIYNLYTNEKNNYILYKDKNIAIVISKKIEHNEVLLSIWKKNTYKNNNIKDICLNKININKKEEFFNWEIVWEIVWDKDNLFLWCKCWWFFWHFLSIHTLENDTILNLHQLSFIKINWLNNIKMDSIILSTYQFSKLIEIINKSY